MSFNINVLISMKKKNIDFCVFRKSYKIKNDVYQVRFSVIEIFGILLSKLYRLFLDGDH